MKKRFALLAVLLLATASMQTTHAQSRGERPGGAPQAGLNGTVVDGASDQAVEMATVAVWNAADSTLATGAVTLADGSFRIDGLRPGRYYVKVSFIGYATATVSDVAPRAGQPQVDLGTIRLTPDMQMLDEVEVSAEREFMEIGIDRTVYNTKDQLVSVGGSAADVLQNIPSVEVDIDGNVSLRGSQNVAILINGRPSPMTGEALTTFLQGLSSDVVERVEVIPNPSAKYEPDGMAGILNIVLRQDRDLGLGGSLSLNAGTRGDYGASGNLTYQQGRLGVFASYGFRTGTRDGSGWRFRENRFLDPYSYLDQVDASERDMLSHTLNTSFDYRLSPQNTLTLSALLSRRGGDQTGLTAYTELDDARLTTARFDRLNEGDRTDFNMDYRFAFKRVVEPSKHEFSAELRYEQEWENDLSRFTQKVFEPVDAADGAIVEQETNEQDERNREASLQVDYLRPLGESGKLEAGYKGSIERLHSDFYAQTFDAGLDGFVPETGRNNTFVYDQQIHAAYGIVGAEIGRFGLQVGVRLEQAFTTFDLETTGEAFENQYFSVFPSAFVTYQASETRTLKLTYSKRINRPRTGGWFNQLNPFNTNEDPFFRRVGNPYLNPEYIHAFEAGFTQFSKLGSLTLTPYFRRTTGVIRFIETIDEQGVTTLTFKNLDTRDSWGAELIGTMQLGRRVNAYASFNAYRVVTDGSNVDASLSNDAIGFASRANATVNLRPGLDLQLSYFYRSPLNIENGRIAARQMADVALRQKLLGDRASLSLRASDVFGTMGFHLWREDALFAQEVDRAFNAQQIGFTFTYNFGQSTRPNRRQRGEQRPDAGGAGDIEMQMQ